MNQSAERQFTLIELMIVMAIIAIVAAIAIPNLVGSRKAANETSAISTLKAIQNAQVLFLETDPDADNTKDYASLTELATLDLIDSAVGSGNKTGYTFRTQPGTVNPTVQWWADAIPVIVGSTGDRHFALNHESILFFRAGAAVTVDTSNAGLSGGAPLQ